ncbi:MAG: sulfurtransferase TusA family protein [Thermoplasmata archaeon]|uniref:Sulfurtransferase TusA family protein n=1 Tax=Candidatus Sysuiplasma superficiale TaxID=2823368 RepID=A0A8J7YKW4_9ARCH|nr:sulfurtransferase TusA family protein [Candidatus Sysuiplasma superficiale]MBX8644349.1 sulfurtransferase TusA family protein [Candidatus Sysuiplasma superficiale]
MQDIKLYKTIDATSENCTGPIGELSAAMNDAYPGEGVAILLGDEATRNDILVWARRTGNEVVVNTDENGRFRIVLRKVK